MRAKRVSVCIVVVSLLLALPVMAEPADGGGSWWSWLAEGWQAVVRVFAAAEEPPAEEPTVDADEPEDAVIVCLPTTGCTEVDGDTLPGLDPDGQP